MEDFNGTERDTFRWLAKKYFDSDRFKNLKKTTRTDYEYCFDVINRFPTKLDKMLSEIPLSKWTNPLVQKLIDKLSDTPSKAKHVHYFIRLVFKWGLNRGLCSHNPAIGTELPKSENNKSFLLKRLIACCSIMPNITALLGKNSKAVAHTIFGL